MRSSIAFVVLAAGSIVVGSSALAQSSINTDPCYARQTFMSTSGEVCRRVLVQIKVNATRSSKDLLDSTTYAAIEAWKILVPGVGYIAEDAFKREKVRRQLWLTSTILPPPGYRHYVHCSHGWTAVSASGAGEGWVSVKPNAGVHRVWVSATRLFKGRNWVEGTVHWHAIHPEAYAAAVAAKECQPVPS